MGRPLKNTEEQLDRLGVSVSMSGQILELLNGCTERDAVLGACAALPADRLSDDDEALIFFTLAVQGSHARRVLTSDPNALSEIASRSDRSFDTASLSATLRSKMKTAVDDDAALAVLRRFKQIESLRIFLREVEDIANVRETTQEIAALAESCLTVAIHEIARRRYVPEFADLICVLGMGKLGGRELNFSSDVDLIFIAADEAFPQMSKIESFAKDLVSWFDLNTDDGYVFRVDLRLRPEGSAGALVPTVSTARSYYEAWGRTWERSALIKARPVGGNHALGEALLQELEPFLYRKYLDYSAIDELRTMKDMIQRNAEASALVGFEEAQESKETPIQAPIRNRLQARMQMLGAPTIRKAAPKPPAPIIHIRDASGVLGWDVKIGIGGIREVEFFVQALQLVHCGTRPGLRVKNTLEALDRLLFAGLINHDDNARLSDAYAFFRAVEHRIQMEQDRQGHRIPSRDDRFENLAWRMSLTPAELRTKLLAHRLDVRTMFDRLFTDSEQKPEKPTVGRAPIEDIDAVLAVQNDAIDTPEIHAILGRLGFERPRQVAGQLMILRQKAHGPFSERALGQARDFAKYLFTSCAGAPNPDQAFSLLTRFIAVVGDRQGYYRMLAEHPHAARLLVHVFGSSPYLGAALLREPAIVERLLGTGTVAVLRSRSEMLRDVHERLVKIEDPDHRIGIIRRFHQEETLRIGLHDYGGAATIVQTHEQLANLAEVVIQASLEEVYEPLRSKKRRADYLLPPIQEIPFCVVALGKLGGRELSFGSDLDLLFIYEYDRQWRLDHSFFAKIAQRLIRALSLAGAGGKMYEVDTRLRPSGQQGALVVSLEQFRSYHEQSSALWERQALVRARPITGPVSLCVEVDRIRHHEVFERGLGPGGADELMEMLEKIRENLLAPGGLDIKYSAGGLVDIEFAVQAIQLRFGKESPALQSPRTHDVLMALVVDKHEFDVDFEQLLRAYEQLRTVESRLRMADLRGISALPADAAQLNVLARRIGHVGADAGAFMLQELKELTNKTKISCRQIIQILHN
jgi:glutamate-ammonia-ligase adenylyltransferase